MADVHVVGAGPAGCVSAINAVEKGLDVHVSEEHPEAGTPRNCSGLFSNDALKHMEKYIDCRKFCINKMRGADIYFDDVVFRVRRKDPVAEVCDRAAIDRAFAEKAEQKGAEISFNERIKDDFRADNIIGADGANSNVAKTFGFPEINRYVGTLQKDIKHKADETDVVEVFLSSKIPGFFGWCIPHNEEECELGVGAELPNNVRKAWNYVLEMKKISAENPSASIIPVETRKRAGRIIDGRNVVLVGDSAGQTKATTGGGLLFGIWCAEIAGKDAKRPRWYDLTWRAKYGHNLAIHRKLRDYLNSLDDKALRQLGSQLNEINFDEYLEKHGNMDVPSKILINPQIFPYLLAIIPGFSILNNK